MRLELKTFLIRFNRKDIKKVVVAEKNIRKVTIICKEKRPKLDSCIFLSTIPPGVHNPKNSNNKKKTYRKLFIIFLIALQLLFLSLNYRRENSL